MDKEYIKKHFVGDLIRTMLLSIIVLFVILFFYREWESKQRTEQLWEAHRQHEAEWQARKEAWNQMTPEQRFESFVFGTDDKSIVLDVRYDEEHAYVRFGPLDSSKDRSSVIEDGKAVIATYKQVANEEGLEKNVVLVGIDQFKNVIWNIE
ncbi:MAG: hypothetical protein IK016_07175 [Lachnospiraceae bacterium]|nr:hypothetical protein [Lachnospiraceae bacterium]